MDVIIHGLHFTTQVRSVFLVQINLVKLIQWQYYSIVGEDKLVGMMGVLHIDENIQ